MLGGEGGGEEVQLRRKGVLGRMRKNISSRRKMLIEGVSGWHYNIQIVVVLSVKSRQILFF